jgi:hypothetical protein
MSRLIDHLETLAYAAIYSVSKLTLKISAAVIGASLLLIYFGGELLRSFSI